MRRRIIAHPKPADGGLLKRSWAIDFVILPILMVILGTHTEVADKSVTGGIAFLVRISALIAFCAIFTWRFGVGRVLDRFLVIVAIVAYFVVVNLAGLTIYAITAAAGITASLWLGWSLSGQAKSELDRQLRAYLYFHLAGLFIACLIYIFTRQIPDLHGIIFPYSSSRAGEMSGVIRLSGFQIEPGNYANFGYIFVLLRVLIGKKIFDLLNTIVILSTVVTLSAWAFVGVAFFLAASVIEFVGRSGFRSLLPRLLAATVASLAMAFTLPIVAPSLFSRNVTQYVEARLSAGETSGSTLQKVQTANAWMHAVGPEMLVGRPLTESFCRYCASPQDLGTLPNMIFYLGFIPTATIVMFAGWGLLRRRNLALLILALPFVVTKLFMYDPLYWLAISIMIGGTHSAIRLARHSPRPEVNVQADRFRKLVQR